MIRYTLLLIIILAFPTKVSANDSLRFQVPVSYKEKQVVQFVLSKQDNFPSPLWIAKIDLNNDAIDEYVIRAQNTDNCASGKLCRHVIIAFQDHKPINIGQFDAHKILISNKKSYGIRQIIVYNDAYNDFKNITASWNPFSFTFEVQ